MKKFCLILLAAFLIPTLTRAQAQTTTPSCGLSNNQNPYIPGTNPSGGAIDWDTFTPPAVGGSYVDALSGCTITRITDSVTDGALYTIYYASQSPFNSNDQYMMIDNNGSFSIRTGPALSGVTPGTVVIANYPGHGLWDNNNSAVAYYANGTQIHKTTMSGTCTSTSNCTITNVVLHDFSSGTPSYSSITFPDKGGMSQDGTTLSMIGRNSSGTMDIDNYQPASDTTTVQYTTTCTAGSSISSVPQPGCIHSTMLNVLNQVSIGFSGGSGVEVGEKLITSPGNASTATMVSVDPNELHKDFGTDASGTPVFVTDHIATGKDACPGGQWPSSGTGGGGDLVYFTDPTNANGDAVCVFNKNWANPHISWRNENGQPWVTFSFDDNRSPGAEYFTNDASYVAPTCTQTETTVSGTCWFPYQNEIDMVRSTNNMDATGTSGLADVYRMGWARSRTRENYWSQILATESMDANYIAFTSNMAHISGCTSSIQSGTACADVYVISAANGGPIFGGAAAPPPTKPAAPTGLTATVQ